MNKNDLTQLADRVFSELHAYDKIDRDCVAEVIHNRDQLIKKHSSITLEEFKISPDIRADLIDVIDNHFEIKTQNKTTEEIVDSIFLDRIFFSEDDLSEVKNNLEDFQKIKLVENFHNFDSENLESVITVSQIKSHIDVFVDVKNAATKFEILANIACFLEHYSETEKGIKFLDNLSKIDSQKDIFDAIVDEFNQHSLYRFGKQGSDNKYNYHGGGAGQFDGLFLIDGEVKFTHLQISSTLSSTNDVEGDSLLRHMIGGVYLAKTLDDKLQKISKTKHISKMDAWKIFSDEEKKKIKGDHSLRVKESLFVRTACRDFFDHENFTTIHDFAREINNSSNTMKVFSKIIGEDVKEMPTDEQVKKFLAKKEKLNAKSIFYGVTSSTNGIENYYNQSSIKDSIYLKDKENNKLSFEEFKLGVLMLSMVDSSKVNKFNFSSEQIIALFEAKDIRTNKTERIDFNNLKTLLKDSEKILFEKLMLDEKENLEMNWLCLGSKSFEQNVNNVVVSFLDERFDGTLENVLIDKLNKKGVDVENMLGRMRNFEEFEKPHALKHDCQKESHKVNEKIKERNERVSSELTSLNMALDFGAGASYFSKNKKLKELYVYFEKKGFNGVDKKVKFKDYQQAMVKIKKKKSNKEKFEFPKVYNADSLSGDEIVSKSSYKLPKSKK
jgi:hypothetical protein